MGSFNEILLSLMSRLYMRHIPEAWDFTIVLWRAVDVRLLFDVDE